MQLVLMLSVIVAALALTVVQAVQIVRMGYHVSKNFHSKITRGILRSPISFFDANPVGAILTRFTQDAHTIDAAFFLTMGHTVNSLHYILMQFITCVVACWLVFQVLILIVLACLLVVRIFHASVIYIRTHAAKKRAKINSLLVLLNEGLPSIRATGR